MALYFAIFFIPIAALSFLDFVNLTNKQKNLLYIIICIYILAFSLNIFNASGDYVNYEVYYTTMATPDNYYPNPNDVTARYEPGFAILTILVNKITSNPYAGIAIMTAIVLAGFFSQFRKYSPAIFLLLAIYIGHFYWWFGIVLLRQAIAMVFLFPVLYLVYEKKYIKAVLCIFAASCFHYSSAIFLLALPLLRLNINTKTSIILVVISFFLGFFSLFETATVAMLQYIPRGDVFIGYLTDAKKSLNILYLFEIIAIMLIALYYRQKLLLENKYTNIAINYLLIAAVIGGLLQHYEIASRFLTFFCFGAYLILLPTFAAIFKSNKYRILYYVSLNLYLLAFLVRLIAFNT